MPALKIDKVASFHQAIEGRLYGEGGVLQLMDRNGRVEDGFVKCHTLHLPLAARNDMPLCTQFVTKGFGILYGREKQREHVFN